ALLRRAGCRGGVGISRPATQHFDASAVPIGRDPRWIFFSRPGAGGMFDWKSVRLRAAQDRPRLLAWYIVLVLAQPKRKRDPTLRWEKGKRVQLRPSKRPISTLILEELKPSNSFN